MSDREKSNLRAPRFARVLLEPELQPPQRFSPDHPLRESFARMIRPEERFALEQACDSLLELTREAENIIAKIPGGLDDDLSAAAADLRYTVGLLTYLGTAEGDVLERWKARLADAALRLAPKVGEIAAEIEAAIAAVAPAE